MSEFYDSVRYGLIPGKADAALYHDGRWPCPQSAVPRFGRVRWITIASDHEHCGIIDFEPGNPCFANPQLLVNFVRGRNLMGKRSRVYCDRDNLPRAQELLGGLETEWWVSTLDGDKLSPGFVPGLWAVQYEGGSFASYDKSVLYGEW